jgi:hypothetical protein
VTFQQRVLLALVMCAAILFTFNWLFPPPEPAPEDAAAGEVAEGEDEAAKTDGEPIEAAPAEAEAEPSAAEPMSTVEVVSHRVANDLLEVVLTNRSPARDGIIEALHLRSEQFEGHATATDALGLGDRRTLEIEVADPEGDVRVPARTAYEVRERGPTHFELGYRDPQVEVSERFDLLAGYEAKLTLTVTNRSAPTTWRTRTRATSRMARCATARAWPGAASTPSTSRCWRCPMWRPRTATSSSTPRPACSASG